MAPALTCVTTPVTTYTNAMLRCAMLCYEAIAAAEAPIVRRWYESEGATSGIDEKSDGGRDDIDVQGDGEGSKGDGDGTSDGGEKGCGGRNVCAEGSKGGGAFGAWVGFVEGQLSFVGHAASPARLPVPDALSTRLVRQARLLPSHRIIGGRMRPCSTGCHLVRRPRAAWVGRVCKIM